MDNNLRIKAVYMPGVHGDEPIVTADGENLDGLLITDPQQILDMGADCSGESHGIHCAAIAAGSPITFKDNVLGGMAPEADIVLCPFQQASPADDNNVGDNDADEEDKEVMNLINGIRFVHDYAHREGKPYIISLSLNSHDGTHDGTSLISTMFDDLIQNGCYMVLATGNEGGDSCYISRLFAENDTLHTILTQEAEVYAYSRQTSEIGCQIGLFNVDTLKEEWRSPLLTNKNGNILLNIDFEADEVEDMGFDGHPEVVEEIKNALGSAIDDDVAVKLSVSTQPDGHACVRFEVQGSLNETYVFTFHLTSPQGNIVDMWGDSGTTFANLIGSDYYTLGSSSISMGDWGTGGNIITVGSWAAKSSFINIEGQKKDDGSANALGAYSDFTSYGTDLAGHSAPFISAPGSMIISAVSSNDENYVQTDGDNETGYSSEVVCAVDDRYCWGSMSGTSMATPTVAGIIALWLEAKPDVSYEEIKEAMAASAITDDFTKAAPIRYGNGKIDAYRGLLHVLGISTRIPELSRHQPQDVTFRLSAGRLTLVGVPDGTPIRVYTTEGILVADSALQDGCISLPATAPGVYAVQVGKYGSILIRK
jgi:subtilisin family serine protease